MHHVLHNVIVISELKSGPFFAQKILCKRASSPDLLLGKRVFGGEATTDRLKPGIHRSSWVFLLECHV